MSGWVAGAVAVGSIGSAIIGSNAARDAANTSAAAADRANILTQAQYEQTRDDLAPYRQVATGRATDTTFNEDAFAAAQARWDEDRAAIKVLPGRGQTKALERDRANAAIDALGARPTRQDFTTQNYEGGALNELAEYGRSRENPAGYIPQSSIPQHEDYLGNLPQINSNIPQFYVDGTPPEWSSQGSIPGFNVQGTQPQYNPNFDMNQDPGVQFRQQEQERSINRNMAGAGKLLSGNRLEELMSRSGELASQEYGTADARNARNYDINRLFEQEGYGRDLTAYDANRQNEATGYGRDRSIYDTDYQREGDIYSRGLTAYDANRQNEAMGYGRDVDAYSRDYSLNTDRYNADIGRENLEYGRGVDAYGRAYGQEGDYLNRLANLSSIGQTATNTGAQAGSYAASAGSAAIQNSGNAQAAGQIGQASAWQGALGDLTSLGTAYAMRQPQTPTWTTDYNPVNTPYMPARYN